MSSSAEPEPAVGKQEAPPQEAPPQEAPPQEAPPLGWDAFAQREVPPVAGDFISPEGELISLLQRQEQELRRSHEQAAADTARVREVVFGLAVFAGRLDQLTANAEDPMTAQGLRPLHRQFRVLKDQMLQALTDGGVEVRDPTGLPARQVMDWADVTGWVQRAEFTEEVVAQTHEQAVFHGGAVVRLASVVMGAPQPAGEAAETTSSTDTDGGTGTCTDTARDTEPDEGTKKNNDAAGQQGGRDRSRDNQQRGRRGGSRRRGHPDPS
jgi:hypothetical protein